MSWDFTFRIYWVYSSHYLAVLIMITTIPSVAVTGLDGVQIDVEVDIQNGLSKFFIVGLPDTAIQESRERVRSAIKNSGYQFPRTRITVNLAPADAKKSGPSFDLPIAIGLVARSEKLDQEIITSSIFIWELALDGVVRSVSSVLPTVLFARDHSFARVFVPRDNATEAALVPDIQIVAVDDLTWVIGMLSGSSEISYVSPTKPEDIIKDHQHIWVDFSHVIGQQTAKRALLIAAAGGHNILMEWPPWSGKTMLAQAFAGILPDMAFEEIIEVSKIYSVAGLLTKDVPLVVRRPFRKIHHTASAISIIGWGRESRPWEISLAHKWVLFLDELLEFPSQVLETLRQPVEDGEITISRVHSSYTYPARFMLVGALNPCPCGYLGDTTRECRCPPYAIERYRSRLSGPLLDRIDIFLKVPRVDVAELKKKASQSDVLSSDDLRNKVQLARHKQRIRMENTAHTCNAEMKNAQIQKDCQLDDETHDFLQQAVQRLDLSTRAYFRILKLARTIADLDDRDEIVFDDVAEAIGYR